MCCAACSCGTWRLKFVRCVRKAFCVHTNPFCPATASVCFYDQVNNEQAWRQLNRNVLMKTRKPTPVVRFAALRITQELFKTLGEDFMQMLPESIPFLSELMEDESEDVETLCQRLMKELEEISGEKLDEYLE